MNQLYRQIFKKEIPLIDVRAPVEFGAGCFPKSVNLFLMNDEERKLVGTCYKQSGQSAAIELGHQLVNELKKKERVENWINYIKKNPDSMLYCFRGGLRSQISRQWIRERGLDIEVVPGGYKNLRRFLMEVLCEEPSFRKIFVLAGKTGSGKTEVLKKLKSSFIDLEKHANHKGSSFGSNGLQPSQITFENRVAADFLKVDPVKPVFIEDESIMIGSLIVPRVLFDVMMVSPLIVLERPLEERVSRIIQEYVIEQNLSLIFMLNALERIRKKLGGLNYSRIQTLMKLAYEIDVVGLDLEKRIEAHRAWVEYLLVFYYDPFYERNLKRHENRIIFRGSERDCLDFMQSNL